ncbi:MAG TPA: CHAP domain-containing protein [Chitinophagaceae bacterium]|jgi:surface antigen|nr:CHAP domain-containing protein [Chitinophagaceae bacterium]
MKISRLIFFLIGLIVLGFIGFKAFYKFNFNYSVGQRIDSLNGVFVYYNGSVSNVSGRNKASDGYNLGMKYQCVEFVKRYYYEYLKHKMPNSFGNAIDFFDRDIGDGQYNKNRDLIQYTNPGKAKPKPDDLLIYSATKSNKYGHVAIVSKGSENEIEIIQQNPGRFAKSRETYKLENNGGEWIIKNKRILGWLRKE